MPEEPKERRDKIMKGFLQTGLVLTLVSATWWQFGYVMGMDRGSKESLKIALSTNPPSEELELTCAGLWIGEQNRKYWEKENGPRLPRNGYAVSHGK